MSAPTIVQAVDSGSATAAGVLFATSGGGAAISATGAGNLLLMAATFAAAANPGGLGVSDGASNPWTSEAISTAGTGRFGELFGADAPTSSTSAIATANTSAAGRDWTFFEIGGVPVTGGAIDDVAVTFGNTTSTPAVAQVTPSQPDCLIISIIRWNTNTTAEISTATAGYTLGIPGFTPGPTLQVATSTSQPAGTPTGAVFTESGGSAQGYVAFTISILPAPSGGGSTTTDLSWTGDDGFGAAGCAELTYTGASAGDATVQQVAGVACTPGTPISVWLAAKAVTTPRAVQVAVNWLDNTGTLLSTDTAGVGTDATIWDQFGAFIANAPASTATAQIVISFLSCNPGEQHRFGLVAVAATSDLETWTPPPGPEPGGAYPLYTAYVSQWKQLLDLDGVLPYVYPELVDALAPLAQPVMVSQYQATVLGKGPLAFYPLDEPSGSLAFRDIGAAGQPSLTLTTSKYGAAGAAAVIGANPLTPTLEGQSVQFNSPSGSAKGQWLQAGAAGTGPYVTSTGGCSVELWWDATSGFAPVLFAQNTPNGQFAIELNATVDAGAGRVVTATFVGANGVSVAPDFGSFTPGVHHVVATLAADQKTATLYVDGVPLGTATAASVINFATAVSVTVGSQIGPATGSTSNGSVQDVAVYNYPLTAAQVLDNYTAGATGYAGDSTDQRIQRVLGWIPWYGSTGGVFPGISKVQAQLGAAGQEALDVLQSIAGDDEMGSLFITADGSIGFRGRHWGFLNWPRFVFGPNDAAGQIPYYSDLEIDTDTEFVTNTAQVARNNGVIASATNPASVKSYFPLPLTSTTTDTSTGESVTTDGVTTNITSDLETIDHANWAVNAYGQPQPRITQITIKPSNLDPSIVPLAWYCALTLEVGDRVTVVDAIDATVSVVCVVDTINPTVGETPGEFELQLQLSPLPQLPLVVAAARADLSSAMSSGSQTMVLGPFADAATNPVESLLRVGSVLTVNDPNGPESFVVTAPPASSNPGAAGYTSVTLTVARILGSTALAAGVGAGSATSNLTLAANSPAGTTHVLVDGEIMQVLTGAGTASLLVDPRVNSGTSTAAHATGAPVQCYEASAGAGLTHAQGLQVSELLADSTDGNPVQAAEFWDQSAGIGAYATFAAPATSGATSISILPVAADWPTNTPPLYNGDKLILDPGTANQETVTVAGSPVQTTTMIGSEFVFAVPVSALVHTHSSAFVVCEPLPSGVTHPSGVTPVALVGY